MKSQLKVFMFLLQIACAVGLAGCGGRSSAESPALASVGPGTEQAVEPQRRPPAPRSAAPAERAASRPPGNAVISECGASTMTLECTARSEGCDASALWFHSAASKRRPVAKPAGMDRYMPVGLACAASKGGPVFVVEYGELPEGCKFCEWRHVYGLDGRPLTASDPPVRVLKGMDPVRGQAPNNDDYDRFRRERGLEKPEIEYLH